MLDNIKLNDILFIDIETVPAYPDYSLVPDIFKNLWIKKTSTFHSLPDESPERLYKRAGIYAEFGKAICISAGYFDTEKKFHLTSFYNDDERELLNPFAERLNKFCSGNKKVLCAHNGKEFDFPFIARRMLIHGIKLPKIIDTAGKKPWEVNHLDTMELWKFGDYKSYTSLVLLASAFNIPTPKDDIDGSQVGEVYWKGKDLKRIVEYCQKDVITIAKIILKFKTEKYTEPLSIEYH